MPMHPLLDRLRWVLVLACLATSALAQVTVPTLGTRGTVDEAHAAALSDALRDALRANGFVVRDGALVTPGLAASLDPELTRLIAELDGSRYAVSGELSVAGSSTEDRYLVNVIMVDVAEARVSDVLSRPIDGVEVDEIVRVASSIAEEVDLFIRPTRALPEGDGGIFVSSEPRGATIFVDGIGIGRTPDVPPVSLAEGRYRLEVRADGYLPSIRYVEVASGDTRFVHVVLTPEQGGSVQVESSPLAEVVVEGRLQGRTPLTIPVTPGRHVLTIARDGFEARQVEVPVRAFRVTRMNVALDPVATPLVYWDPPRVTVVRINGELQRAQAAKNLGAGAVRIELIESGRRRTIDAVLAEDGVYFLDLEAGTLEQTSP